LTLIAIPFLLWGEERDLACECGVDKAMWRPQKREHLKLEPEGLPGPIAERLHPRCTWPFERSPARIPAVPVSVLLHSLIAEAD